MKSSQHLKNLSNSSLHGFLLINKPEGVPSFSIVKKIRSLTGVKKVGYAGTLDPFASGLLILALGKSYTTQISKIHLYPKSYSAQMVLGLETNTLDSRGSVILINPNYDLSKLDHVLHTFKGTITQEPPIFSAKKINGRRAYELARKGHIFKISPQQITIFNLMISIVETSHFPVIEIQITCSTGTYIRSLIRDIAKACNTVGYTKSLVRTKIGPFKLKNAIKLNQLNLNSIQKKLIQKEFC